MPNRVLSTAELEHANLLLREIRNRLQALAGDDANLLFAYRRKIAKELGYDERSKPMVRRQLKVLKRRLQDGLCAVCREPLPERYIVLESISGRGWLYRAEHEVNLRTLRQEGSDRARLPLKTADPSRPTSQSREQAERWACRLRVQPISKTL